MQPVVSSEQMRWCDEATISKVGVPGLLLMDRAGTSSAHLILNAFPPDPGACAVVLCGKGNNGGDGFVVARTLAENGYAVYAVLTSAAASLRGDARTQFGILKRWSRVSRHPVRISSFGTFQRSIPARMSIVVDAIFGTGFHGTPKGTTKKAILWSRTAGVPVISIDVPSGIDATFGTADGVCVHADMTTTFGLVKSGLLLNDGRDHSGHVLSVDIGIPYGVVDRVRPTGLLVEQSDIRERLPRRPRRLHKYSAGKVLVIAGSEGFTGAPSLAAHAALRTGAGAVRLLVPEGIYPILARKRTDEVVEPVRSEAGGTFGTSSIKEVVRKLAWADMVLIGPGIGLEKPTVPFVEAILRACSQPMLIDADALTILAASPALRSLLRRRDWILTPHTGEFDRFVRKGNAAIERDRIGSARRFLAGKRSTLLLKGAPTVVATGKDECYINPTGNPGMATIGSGDVLAGCIAALRAQGMTSGDAAFVGAYLHGRAGDLAADVLGERSVVASDLLQYLPVALREFSQ